MKISELTTENLVDYLRIDDASDIELEEIEEFKTSAIAQIVSYTGLTEEELDSYEDITQALRIIVADMFDNRNLYIEGKASNINKSAECILKMHSVNLL